VRITDVSNKSSPYQRDFYLDWAAVKVYHAPAGGPCQYAADKADIAKAAGIEVYTIGYGVGTGDSCTGDTGAWSGKNALDLLRYMATDQDHFFSEPTKGELKSVFEVIGSQLTGGTRLVE
jgi:hypothetical protein